MNSAFGLENPRVIVGEVKKRKNHGEVKKIRHQREIFTIQKKAIVVTTISQPPADLGTSSVLHLSDRWEYALRGYPPPPPPGPPLVVFIGLGPVGGGPRF